MLECLKGDGCKMIITTNNRTIMTVDGRLRMFEQEGGFCHADVTVGNESIDNMICELLNVKLLGRGGAPNVELPWCKITIEVLDNAKETRTLPGRSNPMLSSGAIEAIIGMMKDDK